MKHIKSFNESVIENDIQSLKDIFIHLKDKDLANSASITITWLDSKIELPSLKLLAEDNDILF